MAYTGFAKLKGQLAHEKGVTDPGALAAAIGRKKYGAKAMSRAAKSGHSLEHHKALKSFVKRHGK